MYSRSGACCFDLKPTPSAIESLEPMIYTNYYYEWGWGCFIDYPHVPPLAACQDPVILISTEYHSNSPSSISLVYH